MRVVAAYGAEAASMRVRVHTWLERLSIAPEYLCYAGFRDARPATLLRAPILCLKAERALRSSPRRPADVVFLQRQGSPLSSGAIEVRILRAAGRGVFDFDDALQWDWRGGLVDLLRRPVGTLRAVQAADMVIAGNETLADWASTYARSVIVIPSCVDPTAYSAKRSYDLVGPPRLGWIGSPSTERFLVRIAASLLEVHRRTGAVLLVMSAGNRPLGPLDAITRRVEWSPTAERKIGELADLAIMPLTDSAFTRGKCGYKLLQYGAAGLPAVASPISASAEIGARLGYLLPRTDDGWVEALTALLSGGAADRATMGRGAHEAVVAGYSYDRWLPTWHQAVFGAPMDSRQMDMASVLP